MSTNIRLSAGVFAVVVGAAISAAGCKNDAAAAEKKVTQTEQDINALSADKKDETIKSEKKAAADKAELLTSTLEATSEKQAAIDIEKTKADKTDEAANEPGVVTEKADEKNKTELIAGEGLQLAELTVARGIEEKNPLDPKTTYKLGEFERIVAFMSVLNPAETADEIKVSFRDTETGKERGKVAVGVGAQKKWRTWAFTRTIDKTGKWEILVRDKNDQLLGRAPFEILPAE